MVDQGSSVNPDVRTSSLCCFIDTEREEIVRTSFAITLTFAFTLALAVITLALAFGSIAWLARSSGRPPARRGSRPGAARRSRP